MNFTTDIILTTKNGTIIGGGQNIPSGQIVSHYPNIETYLHLFLTHEKPLPKGGRLKKSRNTLKRFGHCLLLSGDLSAYLNTLIGFFANNSISYKFQSTI